MSDISIPVTENCINDDSYGEICVLCNACGRFDKATQRECALEMYMEKLQEQYNFNNWIEGLEEHQKKVNESNIRYYKEKIKELED